MKIPRHSSARPAVCLTGLLCLAAMCSLHAQTWDSGGANNNWSTANNWNFDAVPLNNGTANIVFGTGADTNPVLDLAWNVNLVNFQFGAPAFVLYGSQTLTVRGGGITNAGFASQQINLPLVMGTAQTWQSGPGVLTIVGPTTNGGNLLTVDGDETNLYGAISGTGGITKNGAGILTIGSSAANTYTGTTTVNDGYLLLSKASADSAVTGNLVIGDGVGGAEADVVQVMENYQIKDTAGVTIRSSGMLLISNGAVDDFAALTMTGGKVHTGSTGMLTMKGDVTATSTPASTATISGNLSLGGLTRAFTVNPGPEATDMTVSAVISSGGITKSGAGMLQLTAANTFSGGFVLSSGTVSASHNSALGTGTVTLPGNGTLVAGGGTRTFSNSVLFDGGLTTSGFGITFSGPVTLASNCTLNTAATTELSGIIGHNGGNSSLIKSGTSTLTLSGPGANTHGTTMVNSGTLLLDKSANTLAVNDLVVGDGGGGFNADIVRCLNHNQIGGHITTTFSGLLDLNGFDQNADGVTMAGGTIQTGAGSLYLSGGSGISTTGSSEPAIVTGKLTLSTANIFGGSYLSVPHFPGGSFPELDIPANIGGGFQGLYKSGSGTVHLRGNNSYAGGTWLQGGTLLVGSATALGTDPLTLDGGALQASAGGLSLANAVNISANSTITGTHGLTINGAAALTSAAATLSVDGPGVITMNGGLRVPGGGALIKTGTGTLTIPSANPFAGAFTLSGGALTAPGLSTDETGSFAQNGGTVFNGTLTSRGAFKYYGGVFNGRLVNHGSTAFNAGFAAGNGIANHATLALLTGRSIAANGAGLDNQGGITLDGGTLTGDGPLVNNALISGTGTISGSGGFANNAQLSATGNLTLANTAAHTNAGNVDVPAGVQLRLTGANLTNTGSLNLAGGIVTGGAALNNNAGGLVAGRGLITGPFANAGGTVQPQGGTLTIASVSINSGVINLMTGSALTGGAISNSGSIQGDGTIASVINNGSGGEVRAQPGKSLYFTGTTGLNSGRVNLQGGMVAFAQPHTLTSAGQINGSGVLSVPASPVPSSGSPGAGLNVSGPINLSGGDSLLFGTIAMNAGSRLVASGGATASFFDVFRHNGSEVKASSASNLVFFAEVRGAGSFTGSGTIYMEGGYSPGNSAAAVSLAPQIVFTPSNTLTLEIGGRTAGTEHDNLTFTHTAAPQVEWGGTLAVTLTGGFTPAAGDRFDVFDFTRAAGTFATLSLAPLPAGLTWDTGELYTTGILRVITGGLSFGEWATSSGIPGALPGGDHDSDGFDNATEFALGLFPPQPGSTEPNGGFHIYFEGERLRLHFTRPLDRTGVTLRIQASGDLTVWDDLAVSTDSAPFTGPGFVSENRAHPLSDPGLVEVRDTLNTSTTPRRQMRVRVEIAP